jgi:hypothetical protein
MKITQDVREYAPQKQIDEQAALGAGMKEKCRRVWGSGWRDLSIWQLMRK